MLLLKSVYVKEEDYEDVIFNNMTYNNNKNKEEDGEYKTPSVRTWYYTNMINETIWIDTDGVPMTASYSNRMFNDDEYDKGVFVVKSYSFKTASLITLNALVKIMESLDFTIEDDDLIRLKNDMLQSANNYNSRKPFNMRFVYFVSYEDIKADLFCNSKIRIGLNLENLYRNNRNRDTTSSNVSLTVYLKNHTVDNSKKLFIGTDKIEIPTIKSKEEFLNVNIQNSDGITIYDKNLLNHEMGLSGLVKGEEFDMEKLISTYSDNNSEELSLLATQTKALSEWRKSLADQEVSLHKVTAYAINNLSAELKLDKEEATAFKDGIKLLKELIL